MEAFKVAVVQYDPASDDKEKNIEKAAEKVKKASRQGAKFVVLPEYFSIGGGSDGCDVLAEPVPGYTVERLMDISKNNGVYICGSMLEGTEDHVYNTAIFTSPDGELIATYRKMHLFMDEQDNICAGDETVVVETEYGKIGLMICYDAIFPEVARDLGSKGAELILVPSNWPDPFKPQWQLATSARALDNQVWLAAANCIGADDKFTYFGNSRIVAPTGVPVDECGDEEEISISTVRMDTIDEFKETVNFLEERRPP